MLLLIAVITAAIFVFSNIAVGKINFEMSGQYRVDANRIAADISENGYENLDLSRYKGIVSVEPFSNEKGEAFFNADSEYLIKEIGGTLYRIDYNQSLNGREILIALNISLGILTVFFFGILLYIRHNIIVPFNSLSDIPYELAKGNLTSPLKEQKGKYFGKFIWGVNLLRERLEEQKEKELQLQKEKKTLLLSLSHDIKTPLGVIELYSKALEKNLYKDEEKHKRIAVSITEKCGEIKKYIDDITSASSDDFLNLEVKTGEVYLSNIIDKINSFYTEKLELLKIDFSTEEYSDCIILADEDRSVEVLQNLIENAIKYGDGKYISVSFAQEDGCLLVTVKNSGCTLSENELPHIFECFWRGSNVKSNNGSGLGLYICRKLMNSMDGEIFAEIKDGCMLATAVFRIA